VQRLSAVQLEDRRLRAAAVIDVVVPLMRRQGVASRGTIAWCSPPWSLQLDERSASTIEIKCGRQKMLRASWSAGRLQVATFGTRGWDQELLEAIKK
jgi:hypothetical protein